MSQTYLASPCGILASRALFTRPKCESKLPHCLSLRHSVRPRKGICQLAFVKNSKQASLGLPAVCQRGERGENLGVMVAAFLLLIISPISEVRKGHFCSCASPALNEALWCPRVRGPEACSY